MKIFPKYLLSDRKGLCMILPFLGGITRCGNGKSNRGTKVRMVVPKIYMGVRLMRLKKSFLKVYPMRMFLIPVFSICFFMQTAQAAQERMLIPSGRTVGITMDTDGLLVLGTGSVNGKTKQDTAPCKGILQAGDMILKANGQILENKEMLMEMVEKSDGKAVSLLVERNGRERELSVLPVFSAADGSYKIGAWIRDSIQGIGTVTYIDPNSGTFGALGHGVYDADTDMLMDIREGSLTEAELTGIVKGQKGKTGELTGKIELQEKIGVVEENTETGIFGKAERMLMEQKAIPAAERSEIKKGKAEILSDLEGKGICSYEIEIEGFGKKSSRNHKDMIIRITDERLLRLTGGIVQGMSGSPIIQDGKLAGAVTYVLLNDPTQGYGIFIENMFETVE